MQSSLASSGRFTRLMTLGFVPGLVGIFSLHIGHADSAQLRDVAMRAAEAAAVHLDGEEDAHREALEAAVQVLAKASASEIGAVMLETVSWERADGQVTSSRPVAPELANAVRLEVAFVEPTFQQRLASWLAGSTRHAAVAVRWSEGAGAVDCYLPLQIPVELADADELRLGREVSFASTGQPTTAQLAAQTSDCWLGGRLAVGDTLQGVATADARVWERVAEVASSERGLHGPVALVDEHGVVSGFTWVEVDAVGRRSARVRLTDTITELHGAKGGGPDHGIRFSEVRSAAVPTRDGAA